MRVESEILYVIYKALFDRYGPQHWWPGESVFEVLVGAILTQNTAWSNVEKAIHRLKSAGKLNPGAILECTHEDLAGLLRPTGYFNVKARRLQSLCEFILESGGLEDLDLRPTDELRITSIGSTQLPDRIAGGGGLGRHWPGRYLRCSPVRWRLRHSQGPGGGA